MKKAKPVSSSKLQCFAEDEQEEEKNTPTLTNNLNSCKKKKFPPPIASIGLEEAVAACTDPIVNEFDALYDDFHVGASKKVQKATNEPKYAQFLMQKATERKQAHDRVAALNTIRQRYAERGIGAQETQEELIFVTEAYAAAKNSQISNEILDAEDQPQPSASKQNAFIQAQVKQFIAKKDEQFIEKYLKIVEYLTPRVTTAEINDARERYCARVTHN